MPGADRCGPWILNLGWLIVRRRIEYISRTLPPAALGAVLSGEFVSIEGVQAYRISSYDRLAPFLINLASDSDLWMSATSGDSSFGSTPQRECQDGHGGRGGMQLLGNRQAESSGRDNV